MIDSAPLDGEAISELIDEVIGELGHSGVQHTVIVVGGSLLAWHHLRDTTLDVDSARPLAAEVRDAVRAVAARHDLAANWLNDSAAAFAPYSLEVADCEVLRDHPRLLVLGAPLREVFLMKLHRADPQDLVDMQQIWPRISDQFHSASDIVTAYYEAYPSQSQDEYLDTFVCEVLGRAGYQLPVS